MLRQIFFVTIIFMLIIMGGAWSVDYVLRHFDGFGRLRIGQWDSFPQSGMPESDPYARARMSKLEMLALGRSEGLVFMLWHDERGEKLHISCSYRLEGRVPESGFFTLYAVDGDLKPKKSQQGRPYILNSDNILRRSLGDYLITISPQPQDGNWLSIEPLFLTEKEGDNHYGLVLTLYDTPIITTIGIGSLDMPSLSRIDGESNLSGGGCG